MCRRIDWVKPFSSYTAVYIGYSLYIYFFLYIIYFGFLALYFFFFTIKTCVWRPVASGVPYRARRVYAARKNR